MKILIVDDSRTMRMIIRRTMKEAGFGGHDVVEAANGVEALDVIDKEVPDLILSDWNMPQMTGIQLLEKLKGKNSKIPFGFVTSEGTDEMKGRASSLGARFYLTKPFTADAFAEQLQKFIK
ncbi:MAG: response regulator [Chlamydiia bacterium]|nr:response regulator [Chlamydiia bacterium]